MEVKAQDYFGCYIGFYLLSFTLQYLIFGLYQKLEKEKKRQPTMAKNHKKMKNLYPIVGIIFFFISSTLIAQNNIEFYSLINDATNLAKNGKLDSAIITYEDAFILKKYVHTSYLQKVLKLSKEKKDEVRVRKYTSQINTQLKGTKLELIPIIDSLLREDQRIRSNKHYKASKYYWKCLNDCNCNKQSKKYLKSTFLRNEWIDTDKSNASYLLKLIDEYGYLGEELIGKRSSETFVMLLHYDVDTNNIVLSPILDKALEEGSILPKEYAMILDRHSFFINNTQTYWMWPCSSKGDKLPFKETEILEILERRESIGIFDSKFWQENKREYWILRNRLNN